MECSPYWVRYCVILISTFSYSVSLSPHYSSSIYLAFRYFFSFLLHPLTHALSYTRTHITTHTRSFTHTNTHTHTHTHISICTHTGLEPLPAESESNSGSILVRCKRIIRGKGNISIRLLKRVSFNIDASMCGVVWCGVG